MLVPALFTVIAQLAFTALAGPLLVQVPVMVTL